MSGHNEVLLETSKRRYNLKTRCTVRSISAGIRPRARMYGPKCDKGLYFYQPSGSSNFLILEIVLSRVWTN